MTVAEDISDVISFARFAGRRLSRRSRSSAASSRSRRAPASSAFRPTSATGRRRAARDGAQTAAWREPGLPARLAAFCRQDYGGPVQVLCGAQNRDFAGRRGRASAIGVNSAEATVELVVDPRSHGINRKVSNLINIMPRARHDTLVLSDSDIVVGPNYLRDVTALLASPRVGAVTCLYHGIGGEGLWTRLSALAINSHFLPQAITAVSLGLAKPCCGATIALRRSMLDRIGGFGALADTLADDHAIGVARSRRRATTSSRRRSWSATAASRRACGVVRQQIRVARTIKSIDPIGLCRHDHYPSVAARAARHVVWAVRRGPGRRRRAAGAGDAVPLRRVAVRLAAARLLAHSAAGYHRFRRLRDELLRGDGSLARRRLPRQGGRHPDRRSRLEGRLKRITPGDH